MTEPLRTRLLRYLRHHDTCLKAMQYKAVGLDTNPCDCGLDELRVELSKPEPGDVRELAYDIAARIWTDVLGKRGDYDGWMEDKAKAAEMILALLAPSPSALRREDFEAGALWGYAKEQWEGDLSEADVKAEALRRYPEALHPEGGGST